MTRYEVGDEYDPLLAGTRADLLWVEFPNIVTAGDVVTTKISVAPKTNFQGPYCGDPVTGIGRKVRVHGRFDGNKKTAASYCFKAKVSPEHISKQFQIPVPEDAGDYGTVSLFFTYPNNGEPAFEDSFKDMPQSTIQHTVGVEHPDSGNGDDGDNGNGDNGDGSNGDNGDGSNGGGGGGLGGRTLLGGILAAGLYARYKRNEGDD